MPEYTHKTKDGKRCRIICTDMVTPDAYKTIILIEPMPNPYRVEEGLVLVNPADLTLVSPYDDWPPEARIAVWNGDVLTALRFRRRFAGVDKDGKPLAYSNGADKWGSNGNAQAWDHAELWHEGMDE